MGTHLRVLSESYPMNTNMIGFRWFSRIFASLCFGRKVPQHWEVKCTESSPAICALQHGSGLTFLTCTRRMTVFRGCPLPSTHVYAEPVKLIGGNTSGRYNLLVQFACILHDCEIRLLEFRGNLVGPKLKVPVPLLFCHRDQYQGLFRRYTHTRHFWRLIWIKSIWHRPENLMSRL